MILFSVRVEEMEENFPRGGKEDVTPLERRVLRQKAKEDVLFNEVCVKPDVNVFIMPASDRGRERLRQCGSWGETSYRRNEYDWSQEEEDEDIGIPTTEGVITK